MGVFLPLSQHTFLLFWLLVYDFGAVQKRMSFMQAQTAEDMFKATYTLAFFLSS